MALGRRIGLQEFRLTREDRTRSRRVAQEAHDRLRANRLNRKPVRTLRPTAPKRPSQGS